jgi:hypothetical protein
MNQSEIEQIDKNAEALFPIGTKVRIKGVCHVTGIENEEGVVTAHGWSVQGHGPLVGIKVAGELGSALLYNREIAPCSLEKI